VKLDSFEAIARALDEAGVRYLIAGGLAVNAHGYLRYTKDIDLVLALDEANVRAGVAALAGLGYCPSVPVAAEQLADPAERKRWIEEKNMQVFQLWSDAHRETPIDIFIEEPFPFDAEYERALVKPLFGEIEVRFVSVPTLIRLKQTAGREQDRIDIEHLRGGGKSDDAT
jgi:hypothetical protein